MVPSLITLANPAISIYTVSDDRYLIEPQSGLHKPKQQLKYLQQCCHQLLDIKSLDINQRSITAHLPNCIDRDDRIDLDGLLDRPARGSHLSDPF